MERLKRRGKKGPSYMYGKTSNLLLLLPQQLQRQQQERPFQNTKDVSLIRTSLKQSHHHKKLLLVCIAGRDLSRCNSSISLTFSWECSSCTVTSARSRALRGEVGQIRPYPTGHKRQTTVGREAPSSSARACVRACVQERREREGRSFRWWLLSPSVVSHTFKLPAGSNRGWQIALMSKQQA